MRKGIFLLEKKDADFSQKSLDILRPFFFYMLFIFSKEGPHCADAKPCEYMLWFSERWVKGNITVLNPVKEP